MILTQEMQSALESGVVVPRWLVWISARNFSTGVVETAGFCNHDDDLVVRIGGVDRTYTGAGGMISLDPLEFESGTTVQIRRAAFSMVAPEVEAAVFQYDTRLAPVEIHLALLDPETQEVVGTSKGLSGWVEESEVAEGEQPTLSLGFAASSRAGTKTLAAKKSPESQRKRNPIDKGRDYSDLAAEVKVQWGGEVKDGYFV